MTTLEQNKLLIQAYEKQLTDLDKQEQLLYDERNTIIRKFKIYKSLIEKLNKPVKECKFLDDSVAIMKDTEMQLYFINNLRNEIKDSINKLELRNKKIEKKMNK